MKKFTALICALVVTLSLCACRTGKGAYEVSYLEYITGTESITADVTSKKESSSSKKSQSASSKKSGTSSKNGNLSVQSEITKHNHEDVTPTVSNTDGAGIENEQTPTAERVVPTIENITNVAANSAVDTSKKHSYTYTSNQTHTPLANTKRYYYSILDDEHKEWYRKIDKAVNNLEEQVFIGANLRENNNYYIYFLYMMDNPEHFYLSSTITIYHYEDNKNAQGLAISYSVGNKAGEYSDWDNPLTDELRAKIRAKKSRFDAAVKSIVRTIPANAPDVVKQLLIYDRILMDATYNEKHADDNFYADDDFTAYGVIVNKTGVCESYSEAFQTLCLAVGINCTDVRGYAGGGHEWNCVQLDGEWYMCDLTFDDPIGFEDGKVYSRQWFNVTAAQMKQNGRTWDEKYGPLPECNGTKYSYENYFAK